MTRYKHEFQKNSGSREMVEDEDGEWIKYEDHETVVDSHAREVERLAAENEGHRRGLSALCTALDPVGGHEPSDLIECAKAGRQAMVDIANLRARLAAVEDTLTKIAEHCAHKGEGMRNSYCHACTARAALERK